MRLPTLSAALAVSLLACVASLDEAPEATNALVSTWPAEGDVVTLDRPITLTFSGWLDDTSSLRDAFALRAGNVEIPLDVRWRPTQRSVEIWPIHPRADVTYRLELDPTRISDLEGHTVDVPESLSFTVGTVALVEAPARSFAADVAPLLSGCSCHADDPRLPPLDYASLRESESRDWPGRPLVTPGRPGRSYLIAKLVVGYPDRAGAVMPPPWHGDDRPDIAERVEQWILDGAGP